MAYEILPQEARMRTNGKTDDKLLKERTKVTADLALRLRLQLQRQAGIRELRGKVEFWDEAPKAKSAVCDVPCRSRKACHSAAKRRNLLFVQVGEDHPASN